MSRKLKLRLEGDETYPAVLRLRAMSFSPRSVGWSSFCGKSLVFLSGRSDIVMVRKKESSTRNCFSSSLSAVQIYSAASLSIISRDIDHSPFRSGYLLLSTLQILSSTDLVTAPLVFRLVIKYPTSPSVR